MVSHFRKVGGRENPYRASWERRSRSRSITYHPSLITHHSSLITHHSSLITHHLARRGGYHLGRYEYPLPCWCLKLRGRVLKLGLELELEPIEEREKERDTGSAKRRRRGRWRAIDRYGGKKNRNKDKKRLCIDGGGFVALLPHGALFTRS